MFSCLRTLGPRFRVPFFSFPCVRAASQRRGLSKESESYLKDVFSRKIPDTYYTTNEFWNVRGVIPIQRLTKLQAVVLDTAGTVTNDGSTDPIDSFEAAFFISKRIKIPRELIIRLLSIGKLAQIKEMLKDESFREKWLGIHSRYPDDKDADNVFEAFEMDLSKRIEKGSQLIPGAKKATDYIKKNGLRIASTTAYDLKIMSIILGHLKPQGYVPDVVVTSDHVTKSRPFPNTTWSALAALKCTNNLAANVDDGTGGNKAGMDAGTWSVGVLSGLGYTREEIIKMSPPKRTELFLEHIKERRKYCHILLPSVAELPEALVTIDTLVQMGANPWDHEPSEWNLKSHLDDLER